MQNSNNYNIQFFLCYDNSYCDIDRIKIEWGNFKTSPLIKNINIDKIEISNTPSKYDIINKDDNTQPCILILDSSFNQILKYNYSITSKSLIDFVHGIELILNNCSFMNIILINNLEDINSAVDKLVNYYGKLLEVSSFAAGFQAIVIGIFASDANTTTEEWSLFLFAMGFLSSMGGVLVSLCANQYFNGILNEDFLFIVKGCIKWQIFFYLADMFTILSLVLLMLAINLGIFSILQYWQSIFFTINVIIGFILFVIFNWLIIKDQQRYGKDIRKIYQLNDNKKNSLIPIN